jgi:hypothetical protein
LARQIEIWENQRRPAVISNIPAARIGLKPIRVTRLEAMPAERM